MCGRYIQKGTWAEIHERLSFLQGWSAPAEDPPKRYNLAPTQLAPIVIAAEGHAGQGVMARWDFTPWFHRAPLEAKAWSGFNAKAETVATSRAYREAIRQRRCLAPNDGFFEWKRQGKEKTPYWFRAADTPIGFFAGIWDRWEGVHKGAPVSITSFAILTCEPNALVAPVHDRMPALLRPEDYEAWLFGDWSAALKLVGPYPAQVMTATRIGPAIGDVKNDHPGLLDAA